MERGIGIAIAEAAADRIAGIAVHVEQEMGLRRLHPLGIEAGELLHRAALAPGPAADIHIERVHMADIGMALQEQPRLGEIGDVFHMGPFSSS